MRYTSSEYGSSSYMKVIGSRSRSQQQQGCRISQCKTSIGNNSGSIKHRAMKFACSMGFSTMADRMVWKNGVTAIFVTWSEVTTCHPMACAYLRVVGLRLEGSLVCILLYIVSSFRIYRYTDVIEVMFLCQVAAVASHVPLCPSAGRRRGDSGRGLNGSTLTPDVILLRFPAVDMFLCIGANDSRVRLKRIVSIHQRPI